MGNLQTGEAKVGKSKGKAKGKRGKKGGAKYDDDFTGVVPEEAEVGQEGRVGTTTTLKGRAPQPPKPSEQIIVTDSWCKVNQASGVPKGDIKKEATPPSSSDSNFTDPQTPVGFDQSEESIHLDVEVPSTITESFLHDLTLNSFKLNEYRNRLEEEKTKKLSKLGVSKTSQISLDSTCPSDNFVTDNVEVVNETLCRDNGLEDSVLEREDTLKRKGHIQDFDQEEDGRSVKETVKRMSSADLSNGLPEYKRHMSVPLDTSKGAQEGLVLKKVASLTLSKAELESKIIKPKFVPEKLDFQLYEKFEGHMLVNWCLSEFGEEHPLSQKLTGTEFKLLAVQFCTHLLAAGVLKQIPDKDVPMYNIFKPDCMYYWTHAEVPVSIPQTPGRLSMVSWPPTSPSTEQFASPCTKEAFSPDEDKPVRSHQELRNSARDVEILGLEEEVNRLKQEVEKYKTLIEIQTLTTNAVIDFSSPVDEEKTFNKDCDNLDNKVSERIDIKLAQRNVEAQTEKRNVQSASTQTEDTSLAQEVQTEVDLLKRSYEGIGDVKLTASTTASSTTVPSPPPPPPPPPTMPEGVCVPPPPQPMPEGGVCPPPPPMPGETDMTVPPPPPLPEVSRPSPGEGICQPPPPMPGMSGPPPPPMPGMSGPPPPPMPGMSGPPPPPMPGMSGPPPPPMPGMSGPPAPPMPGMSGPPPPPMPGMSGPPPPPMPGMSGPPPPPPPPGSAGPPPPPPPGGPAPLPAPPTGGWAQQKSALKKPAVTPAVPMKPLYWTRIVTPAVDEPDDTGQPKNALWKEIDELPLDNIAPEFTELFSRQVINRKTTLKKIEVKEKVEAVKLLDSKRSQNVGILAQSLKTDIQEIENAIYNFDTSIVSLEALQQIYEVRANADEIEMIKAHLMTKPDVPLDKPEQFLYELSQISNFAERISCLMFRVEFDDSINTIDHTLTNIKSTCDYLVKSPELKEVMAIILTLGNYMNGGNMSRGQADGFGLEILSKLKDVKSKDSKITLLHYVVRVYMKKIENPFDANVTLPVPEPGDIRRAASVNFDDVLVDLKKLQKQLEACERTTQTIIEASSPENLQPFKDEMTAFIETSKKQLSAEFETLDECHKQFVDTMKFYLFKPKSGTLEAFPPNAFFELWLPFCIDFKDIFKKELIRIEKEKIQEIKRKENERISQIKKMKERDNGLKAKVKAKRKSIETFIKTK